VSRESGDLASVPNRRDEHIRGAGSRPCDFRDHLFLGPDDRYIDAAVEVLEQVAGTDFGAPDLTRVAVEDDAQRVPCFSHECSLE
jgi:hypothetical protein